MLRHEFQPGRLVAGTFLTVAGVVYVGAAGGHWQTPWFVVIPLVLGGLCLAGAIGTVSQGCRRRRRRPRRGPAPGAGSRADRMDERGGREGAAEADGTGQADTWS